MSIGRILQKVIEKMHSHNWSSQNKLILDSIAQKLNVRSPSDWGSISDQQFIDVGGSTILGSLGNSLRTTLQVVYPGI